MTFELRIELKGIMKPVVWRQIKVPIDINFHQLHLYIQAAFGWRDSHLYQFSENGFESLISICSPFDEEGALKANDVSIERIMFGMHDNYLFRPDDGKKLIYLYDYGDSWEHEISFIGFHRDSNVASLEKGMGACPPEDVGGIHGFEDLKRSLKTGKPSKIHGESWIPWLERCGYKNYDPSVFDLEKAKKQFKKIK